MDIFYSLKEIKYRFLYIIFSYLLNCIVLYFYINELIYIFILPLLKLNSINFSNYFIFTGITDIFIVYLYLVLLCSLYLLYPFIIYNIKLFLKNSLYFYEYKFLLYLIILSLFFFMGSIFLLYFIILPLSWNFFISFENISEYNIYNIYFESKIDNYLFLCCNILFYIILIFQLPVIVFILIWYRILNISFLFKSKKIIYIIFLLIATLFSSPDIISQLIVFFLLLILYEIFIYILLLFNQYRSFI